MKNFNIFEKLWEHSRTLRRVGLVLVMSLISITQAWAWNTLYLATSNNSWSTNSESFSNSSGTGSYCTYVTTNMDFKIVNNYNTTWLGRDYGDKLKPGDGGFNFDKAKSNNCRYNGDPGIVEFHCDQTGSNADDYPWIWITRPTIYIRHKWANGSTTSNQAMTDNNDGTYTYKGQFSSSSKTTYVGPCSSCSSGGNTFKQFSSPSTTYGSPGNGDWCIFEYNSSGFKGKGGQSSDKGTLTVYQLYSITYDGNGKTSGSVPTGVTDKKWNETTTVADNTGSLVKTGYVFVGWNTAADGTGKFYLPGSTFTPTATSHTLYAQWLQLHEPGVYESSKGYNKSLKTYSGREYEIYRYAETSSVISIFAGETSTTTKGDKHCVAQFAMDASSNAKFGGWIMHNGGISNKTSKASSTDAEFSAVSGSYGIKGWGGQGYFIYVKGYDQFDLWGQDKKPSSDYYIKVYRDGSDVTDSKSESLTVRSYTLDPAEDYLIRIECLGNSDSNGDWLLGFSLRLPEAVCGATQPGEISKGTLSACALPLTADGDPASNNTWYWQSAEDGTDKTGTSGATKNVTSAGTYYVRSFYSTGSCWSDARSVTVTAADLTPAAPTALTKSSITAKGVTLTVEDAANTNDYEFYVSTSSPAPGGSTPATHSSNTKSLTITNLYAGTTFYAWARAKCGSNKSAWTALGDGGNFTTSTVTVTHTLTNVEKTSGATTAGGSDYTAKFAAVSGYSMPTPTVTVGGSTLSAGNYTWTPGTGTLTIPAGKINGNIVITLNSAAAAPTSVSVGTQFHYFPGNTITLTATPTGGNGPKTYQWYKGGTADGNAIEGATNSTYTKASCTYDDAGSYYCKVTCAGTLSKISGNFDVKILRLYVKGSKNGDDYGNEDFVSAGDGTTATAAIALGSGWTYGFNISDGCGNYYGNNGTMDESNHTNWTMDVKNGADCGLTTTNAATYTFTVTYYENGNFILGAPKVSVSYPAANQASGKVIYFDNSGLGAVTPYYRIGNTSHSQSTAMTQVYGTANLYKVTTAEYDGFTGWFIANAQGGTGSEKSIYNTVNAPAITKATAHEGSAVTADAVTVCPTTSKGTGADAGVNDNCTFYNYTITDGMKTDRVTITAPTNGTITVSYTDVNNAAQSFTSGNRDLAHTVIITPTATPNTGYALSSLTVNEAAHTSGNTHTVTANTTIAATFSPIKVSSITVAPSSKTLEVGGSQQLTATASPDNALDKTVTWSTSNGSVATVSSTGLVTAVAAGTATITATAHDGSGKTGTCAITVEAAGGGGGECTIFSLEDEIGSAEITTNKNSKTTITAGTSYFFESSSDRIKLTPSAGNKFKNGDAISIKGKVNNADKSFGIKVFAENGSTSAGEFYATGSTSSKGSSCSGTLTLASDASYIFIGRYEGTGTTIEELEITTECVACSTPSAPTATSNGATTSSSQAVSWEDGSNDKWDVYVSTSNSTPAAGVTPTASGLTAKTYTFTSLTALTTYYWWVRSVCDASHKSAWVAGSSFTTDEAESPCTPTTLFSMVVSSSASEHSLSANTTITQDNEAISSRLSSISGGGVAITNKSGSSAKKVFASNALSLQNADVQCAIALTGATLQAGDVITVTTTNSGKPYLTSTSSRSDEVTWTTSSYTHSVTLANTSNATGKNLIGKSTFYLWYGSSAVYIRSVSVTRPCDESGETCQTPNITTATATIDMTTAETKSQTISLSNEGALSTVTYAWTNADGTAIAAAANASGTNTSRLTLASPTSGTYNVKCTVTNDCGEGETKTATSPTFTFRVTASTGCPEIAKVIVSSASTGTGSGTKIAEPGGYGVNLEDTKTTHDGKTGYKIGSSKYVYLQLASGEQFQNGDKVKVYITKVSDQGDHKLHIFQGTTGTGTEVATVASPVLGWNDATLSGVTSGQRSLTIHRSSGTTEQNHYIYAFAVERCVDCTPATHEGLAYTKTSYTVGETASALTVTNPENVDTYQWKYNTTNDRTDGFDCGTGTASFTPLTTAEAEGTRYYWCELTNDCGTVKTSAVGITVSAVLSDVTVAWTAPAEVNYGGGGYTITAQVTPAAWDGTLTASMLTAPEGIRIYGVEINDTEHTLQAKFDVQTTFDREANATNIPFALTLAATANYNGKIAEHNVAYSACAAGGGGSVLFSQNFNDATEVAYTNGTSTVINTSSGNNIVGSTAASQFTYIGIVNKSSTGIAINTESGGNSQDITDAFQAYANNSSGKYALVKTTNFAASVPTALRIEADVWFHTLSSTTDYSLSFAVGESFSDGTGGEKASNVHSGFSFYNASVVYLYAYRDKNTKISGTNQFTQSKFQKLTWVINNTGSDLEYTNPAGTKSTLENDKFDVWVGTKQFVSGQAASTGTKALKNLYIGDPNGKSHEFRLDNVTVTDISTSSGTGTITTALTWSNGQTSGATLAKDEGTADFAVTAVRDAAATTSLGAVTYSSSVASVATVNETTGQVHIADNIDFGGATYKETTITATLAASGCYKRAEIRYVLRVNKRACGDVAGTVTSTSDGCTTTLTLSDYTAGASIQWYKDGVSLGSAPGAQTATYAATASGEYYAVTSNDCDRTSNTVTVTSTAVSATKLVDEWYVKNGRRTPDIALVQTENATGFTVTSGGSPITSIGGCEFDLGTDGIIYLKGAKNDDTAPSGMTEGDDVLSITATGCSDAAPVSVTIHRQVETDKYVLAYVVTGKQDGGWTQDLPDNQTTGVELYRTLNNHFDLQATNIYATTDEQKIKEYYSRYDIIFITDYPNTKTKNETTKKSYVNALGAMIDIRPILTMEAWVSGLSNWSAKGVAGNPKSPTTRQYNMLLQCKDHEIFSGTTVETIGEGDDIKYKINMVDSTKALYDTLDTKYGAGAHAEKTGYCYGKHPALQGFVYNEALADMLPLGLIGDGAGNDLQVGMERQKEMEARMMVLGINADAMERLSKDGETVIVNALKYLMKKNAEDISDCSNYFIGGASGDERNWHNVANWSGATLPDKTQEVRILAPCEIKDGQKAHVAGVKIVPNGNYKSEPVTGGSLTINAGGALTVEGKVQAATAPYYYEARPTSAADLILNTNSAKQAALIFDNEKAETQATVNLYSLGRKKGEAYQFQYFASPMDYLPINPAFAGSGIYTYVWHENGGWERRGYYTDLYAFEGVGITTRFDEEYHNYIMKGTLASTAEKEITLTNDAAEGAAGKGDNIIGNSWTAPINIASLRTGLLDDANIVDKTVYIYCTGNDGESVHSGDTEAAGQWLAIPIDASGWDGWEGLKVIPAMQAFLIHANAETTLTLNYKDHVRSTEAAQLNQKLRAPGRRMAHQNEFMGMRMRVTDSQTHTDLYLFEGEQFSEAYDNGWEAKFVSGDGRSAQFYAMNGDEKMAVLATDELEGTPVGFTPGKESNYTISFFGEDNGYYLNDIKLQNSVRISEGETYTFTYEEGDAANRFYISRTAINAPEVATGMENLDAAAPRVQKIIYNDKLYIIRGGRLYDATGKVVK